SARTLFAASPIPKLAMPHVVVANELRRPSDPKELGPRTRARRMLFSSCTGLETTCPASTHLLDFPILGRDGSAAPALGEAVPPPITSLSRQLICGSAFIEEGAERRQDARANSLRRSLPIAERHMTDLEATLNSLPRAVRSELR